MYTQYERHISSTNAFLVTTYRRDPLLAQSLFETTRETQRYARERCNATAVTSFFSPDITPHLHIVVGGNWSLIFRISISRNLPCPNR
jgi:hypothetical protein